LWKVGLMPEADGVGWIWFGCSKNNVAFKVKQKFIAYDV
jgi:hypothetical protein